LFQRVAAAYTVKSLGLARCLAALLVAAVTASGGCSRWSQSPSEQSLLKPPRMSPDSVVLELALVDIPAGEEAAAKRVWRSVDEQAISLELRRDLNEQGVRCGTVGSQLPQWLCDQLESQDQRLGLERDGSTLVAGEFAAQRRLQCRAGKARSVPISRDHLEFSLPVGSGEQDSPASVYQDAQWFLGITVKPLGDGSVQLRLMPEIHHGQIRQRWVGDEGFFRMDASRDLVELDSLLVDVTLMPGQTMVLGGGEGPKSLGAVLFAEQGEAGPAGRLLLLRLAQTQFNDLFAPGPGLPPIATPQP
jgi:hypothetical protein